MLLAYVYPNSNLMFFCIVTSQKAYYRDEHDTRRLLWCKLFCMQRAKLVEDTLKFKIPWIREYNYFLGWAGVKLTGLMRINLGVWAECNDWFLSA